MKKIYKGLHRFQELYFKKDKDFFRKLSDGQSPEVLFITCIDSRIDPNLITQSRPGELLTLRTPGNIVPPFDMSENCNSSAATLEFSVLQIKVKHIIVCGHSDCRAMMALQRKTEGIANGSSFMDWIELAAPVRDAVKSTYTNKSNETMARHIEEENILYQMHNIQTYPFVNKAMKDGRLQLHGWHYDIGTGEIKTYIPSSDSFERVV